MQRTIKQAIRLEGIGLHSGKNVRLTLRPAAVNHGIWFRRTDLKQGDQMVPALWDAVEQTALCTRIVNADGHSVSTIEHLMAAIAGVGISNLLIELDGPEVPILDGSAAPFAAKLQQAGVIEQGTKRRVIHVLRPIEVCRGDAVARLLPAEKPSMQFRIEFEEKAIGIQDRDMLLSNGAFLKELQSARTFCRLADIDAMRSAGLALGGSLENAVVIDGEAILNPEGLRHSDEAVRHKMLDALGDLLLAGAPIIGRYEGHRSGHSLTNELLRVMFAEAGAFRIEEASDAIEAVLPGASLNIRELEMARAI